nr:hypothetical protein [Arthrobacter sp. ISL-30]
MTPVFPAFFHVAPLSVDLMKCTSALVLWSPPFGPREGNRKGRVSVHEEPGLIGVLVVSLAVRELAQLRARCPDILAVQVHIAVPRCPVTVHAEQGAVRVKRESGIGHLRTEQKWH